jgi:hypothetical protein
MNFDMSRMPPGQRLQGRDGDPIGPQRQQADHSGFSANRASAMLTGEGYCSDPGAGGIRLPHCRNRAGWALTPSAKILAGL